MLFGGLGLGTHARAQAAAYGRQHAACVYLPGWAYGHAAGTRAAYFQSLRTVVTAHIPICLCSQAAAGPLVKNCFPPRRRSGMAPSLQQAVRCVLPASCLCGLPPNATACRALQVIDASDGAVTVMAADGTTVDVVACSEELAAQVRGRFDGGEDVSVQLDSGGKAIVAIV